jgi:outer membrane protein TolC
MRPRRKYFTSALLLMAFVSANADSQNTGAPTDSSAILSLDQALSEAQAHSPELRRARADSNGANWRRVETYSGFLPKLQLSGNYLFAEKYQIAHIPLNGEVIPVPFIYPVSDFAVDASINVFDGFQNINNYKAASLLQDASDLDLRWSEFKMGERVRFAYYSALAAKKLDDVAVQNIKTLQDHIEKIRIRKSGGLATNYDVLRVEVQLSEAQSEKLLADDNVLLERKKLDQLLGLKDDARGLTGELPLPNASQVATVQEPTDAERPDLQSLEKREEAADRADSAAGAFLVPKVSVAGRYEWYNNANNEAFNPDPYQNAYQVGVFMTWNAFDGGASIAKSKQAAAALDSAQASHEIEDLKVPYDFEFWKRRYVYSSSLYQSKTEDLKRSEESVRLANEGYKAGTKTVSEQLDAELDLFRARAGAVNAQLSASQSLINLELALGKKVANGN